MHDRPAETLETAARDLDVVQAEDHLQMVDRILARVDEPVSVSGWPFLIWGVYGAVVNIVVQLVVFENHTSSLFWIVAGALVIAVTFMVFFLRSIRNRERRGLLDQHIGNLFMVAWIVALIAMLLGDHIFTNWAQAAIWSLIYGLTMLYCASLVRSRVVFIGGAILIASIVAANYSPAYVGYILAGGNLCGMAATGIVLMTARR
jgi:small-conductance mechanosensitive channel